MSPRFTGITHHLTGIGAFCLLLLVVPSLLSAGSGGKQPRPKKPYQVGGATWYGGRFDGRLTARGDIFDKTELTGAHRSLPLGTVVRVVNTANNHSVVITITDRGPKNPKAIVDLSKAAARELGMVKDGVARVRLYVVKEVSKEAGNQPKAEESTAAR